MWLKNLGEERLFQEMFGCFRSAVLCTKHPGFFEEREWRVIYSPGFEKSDQLIEDIQTIDGIPQPIVKIPLRNIPERGLVGIEVHQLVDRIIVGPSAYPLEIREAFVSALLAAGMENAGTRVSMSLVPLRH